jgi:hypothetical protein
MKIPMMSMYAVMMLLAVSQRIGAEVEVDYRIVANRPDYGYVLRVHNRSAQAVEIDGISGNFYYGEGWHGEGWNNVNAMSGPRHAFNLPPDGRHEMVIIRNSTYLDLIRRPGQYTAWQWRGSLSASPPDVRMTLPEPVLVGYVEAGGSLKAPQEFADAVTVSNLLAFVFHQNQRRGFPLENVPPNELAFLLLNGTDSAIEAVPPLSEGSVLHLSAPGIGYRAAITLPESGFAPQAIPSEACGQWRIPFERILALMPAETVEAIRAADGALDLVWKTGELESPPLPLILLPPTQAELDAAFLAKHADVPRIDEHTNLSLDFRLAGIEGEPILLGKLRNNEKHTVLADDQFMYNNNLDSSFRYAPSSYARNKAAECSHCA